jgi:N-acetylmuramoyl-L-alanine amidase
MSYDISNGRFRENGEDVDFIQSRFVGSAFSTIPKIVVMHFTYGASGRSSAEWFRNPDNPGSSAHVVIDRDGRIFQCVSLDREAWHAGKSSWRGLTSLNHHSFGIELANWGHLQRAGAGWASYTGQAIPSPYLAVHRNGNPDRSTTPIGWEPYPKPQLDVAVALVRALVAEYGVTEIVGHDDIAPTRKWDPGPAFDMPRFRALVFGGRGEDGAVRLRVDVAELNLRATPSTELPARELLTRGMLLEPLSTSGNWIEVSVLDANGAPRITGWVHGRYVAEV